MVSLTLNGASIASAGPSVMSVVHVVSIQPGDVLALSDEGANSVIRLNSIRLDCPDTGVAALTHGDVFGVHQEPQLFIPFSTKAGGLQDRGIAGNCDVSCVGKLFNNHAHTGMAACGSGVSCATLVDLWGTVNGLTGLGLCQAECDTDADCAGDLQCHQRQTRDIPVPGCAESTVSTTNAADWDYCYDAGSQYFDLAAYGCITDQSAVSALAPTWQQVLASEIANAQCWRVAGDVASATPTGDALGTINFIDYQEMMTNPGVIRCDIHVNNFIGVRASYEVHPIDPVTAAAQDPDNNHAISQGGEQPANHAGSFSFGTPDEILDSGNHGTANIAQSIITIPETTVTESNTVRIEVVQSANHEDFSLTNINIAVLVATPGDCCRADSCDVTTTPVALDGSASIDDAGLILDGVDNRARISSEDYASDGSWTVGYWFLKNECSDGPWEYTYSHAKNTGSILDLTNSNIKMYFGCRGASANLYRQVLLDAASNLAIIDYDFGGRFKNSWHHVITSQTGSVTRLIVDGVHLTAADTSNAVTEHNVLGSIDGWTTTMGGFDLLTDIHIGGRADSNSERHFKGFLAGLSISTDAVLASTGSSWFHDQQAFTFSLANPPTAMSYSGYNHGASWLITCSSAPAELQIASLSLQKNRDLLYVYDGIDSMASLLSLLSGGAVSINFQPPTMTVPEGYPADSGAVLADRGNGFTYGWNHDVEGAADYYDRYSRNTRDSSGLVPDSTSAFAGDEIWEIQLPNGMYKVEVGYSDPEHDRETQGCMLQGSSSSVGTVTAGIARVHFATVSVTAGVLTWSGELLTCSVISFIHIELKSLSVTSTGATMFVRYQPDGSVTQDGFQATATCPAVASGTYCDTCWSNDLPAWSRCTTAEPYVTDCQWLPTEMFPTGQCVPRTDYVSANPRGVCCNDLAGVASVVTGSCVVCIGDQSADCLAATCTSPDAFFHGGQCCSRFAKVSSVLTGSCTSCTGDQATDCNAATCAPGYLNFQASGLCCNDFSAITSVVTGSCTSCTSGAIADCLAATCVSGGVFFNGFCCDTFSGVGSVQDNSCTACTSGDPIDCQTAICLCRRLLFIQRGKLLQRFLWCAVCRG